MIETWNQISWRHRRRAWRGWALLLLSAIAAIAIACCGPRPSHGGEPQLVLNWGIAYSGNDPLQVGWDLHDGGWPKFLERRVRPAVAWCRASGVRPTILIHHPFGQIGDPMYLDGYDQAQGAEADWLTHDFATSRGWLSITKEVDCYVYLGGAQLTPRLRMLSTANRAKMICRNLQPLADAGFKGLYLDFAENAIAEPFRGVNANQSAGRSCDVLTLAIADDMFARPTGVEAAPRAFAEFRHLWHRNIVAQDSVWRHRYGGFSSEQIERFGYGQRHGNFAALGYDRAVLTGQVWRLVDYSDDADRMLELARLIAQEGDVPAIGPLPLMRAGIKASDVAATSPASEKTGGAR